MNCKDCLKRLSEREVRTYLRTNYTNVLADYTSPVCAECVEKRRRQMLVYTYGV